MYDTLTAFAYAFIALAAVAAALAGYAVVAAFRGDRSVAVSVVRVPGPAEAELQRAA